MTKGLFTGASKNTAGFYSAIIENTGLGTKYFGVGKFAPKIAANTWVEFEHSSRQVGDKTYYNVEGKLKESDAPAGETNAKTGGQTSPSGSATNSDPRQASIEMQSSISSASRIVAAQITAGVSISNPAAAVGSLVQSFIDMLHPKAAPKKAAPPPAEDSDDFPA